MGLSRFERCIIFIHEILSRNRKTSFIIAKDYFSFSAFTSAYCKEYKGFQWGKATVKVSLLFAVICSANVVWSVFGPARCCGKVRVSIS